MQDSGGGQGTGCAGWEPGLCTPSRKAEPPGGDTRTSLGPWCGGKTLPGPQDCRTTQRRGSSV